MKFFILTCLLITSVSAISNAQKVNFLTVEQLESRFNKGNDTVYVVNFWATWCAPCIAEIPNFEKLQSTYQNQPLKVLMVSVDFKSKLENAVKPFVRKRNLQNEIFLLNEKSQQEYIDKISKNWSGALPATLIVNRNKNIRRLYEKEFTYAELNQVYQELK
ncbi:TlpA family protein disulfide reductase [Daejeonella oryzae]|uniref:TlpA family protein disulfide reductase n=1 Tax=Daejeonella oryzae TaxID=1122943 RepID=UPI000479B30D|nr:TlpA family protein disulfide reductase [Daejeonella oryzae]